MPGSGARPGTQTARQSAQLPWFAPPDSRQQLSGKLLVIGAGLAGCTSACELSRRGWNVTLLEQAPYPANAASGNRRAVLRPHITREPTLASTFFTDGCQAMLELLQSVIANDKALASANLAADESNALYGLPGVLQLLNNARDYPDSNDYQKLGSRESAYRAGIALNTETLFFKDAGWVNIALLCQSMHQSEHGPLSKIGDSGWTVRSCRQGSSEVRDEERVDTYDKVVLASGVAIAELAQSKALTLIPARGQTTVLPAPLGGLESILCGRQTVIPLNGGNSWQVGSTYQRNSLDANTNIADDRENLLALEQMLGNSVPLRLGFDGAHSAPTSEFSSPLSSESDSELSNAIHGNWAGIRATTPDRLPVLGPLPDFAFYEKEYEDLRHGRAIHKYKSARYKNGLYINGGYGSRGLSVAASCAKLLADAIERDTTQSKVQSPMAKDLKIMEMLHPARFLIRELRRGSIF